MKLHPVQGIPVRYDEKFAGISDSRGLWRWKRIYIGPAFLHFPPREQVALLLHEVAHCKLYHLEKRLARIWLALFGTQELFDYCQAQEYEADRYVLMCGYGVELAQAFLRVNERPDPLHPPRSERIARLVA